MNRPSALLIAAALTLFVSVDASAQIQRDDPATLATIRLGPLALTPTLAIRDIGVDTNVYRDDREVRDFTASIIPGTDAWIRIGRLQLGSETELHWQYFRTSTSQSSLSLQQDGTAELLLAFFTPYVRGSFANTRQRLDYEIDRRIRQRRTGVAAGVKVFPGPRTQFDLEWRRGRLDLSDETFGDSVLAEALNRENEATELTARYGLTSLTTFVAGVTVEEDRFEFQPLRDSRSWSVLPGLEFRPFAFISGSARIGYRHVDLEAPLAPDFRGVIAEVDLKYVARDATKIEADASRQLRYSFEATAPVYIETGWTLTFTQAVTYDWDVRVRGGRTTLAYRGITPDAGQSRLDRVDYFHVYGLGLGRRVAYEWRLGFDLDYAARTTTIPGRAYDGLRFGGSITYGY